MSWISARLVINTYMVTESHKDLPLWPTKENIVYYKVPYQRSTVLYQKFKHIIGGGYLVYDSNSRDLTVANSACLLNSYIMV